MDRERVKRLYLVHCFQTQLPWHRKLVTEFSSLGAEAVVLGMPTPREPVLTAWLAEMSKHVTPPWHEVGLLGHSIGAAAVLYFIREYVQSASLAGTVLVAAGSKFKLPQFESQLKTFEFEPQSMAGMRTGNVLMINGEDDSYAYDRDPHIIAGNLSAKLIVIPGTGHFGIPDGPHERRDLPRAAKEPIMNHFGYFPTWS